jgi:prevent-host-death family protein
MKVTTKELRMQPGKIIDYVVKGREVIITYRGKSLAKIVPFKKEVLSPQENETIFGMWKAHSLEKTVEEQVRELRKGRSF